jgi:hypothetical protein
MSQGIAGQSLRRQIASPRLAKFPRRPEIANVGEAVRSWPNLGRRTPRVAFGRNRRAKTRGVNVKVNLHVLGTRSVSSWIDLSVLDQREQLADVILDGAVG